MKLEKINGNTYYIKSPTNIGVMTYKNKNCLLVDTGINSAQSKKLDDVLLENKLHPKVIINTHSHMDHCGGNTYFVENYPGCVVYASEKERVSMENPYLEGLTLFSAMPMKEMKTLSHPLKVNYSLEYGTVKIEDEKMEIVSLPGHCVDQIGVVTPDKVCFLGDSIYSEEIIKKYKLPYVMNVGEFIESLKKIGEINADYFVISHSENAVTKEEIDKLIETNLRNIEKYNQQILELLDQPLTREDIIENLAVLNDFSMGFRQYHLYFASVSAFIAYLYNENLIKYSIENGKVYYYKNNDAS